VPAPLTELRTARLRLRAWHDGDLGAFAALCADPVVMEYLRPVDSRAASDAIAAQVRAHFDRHGFGFWIVERTDGAAVIGVVGLAHVGFVAPFTPAIEIGWRLAPAQWGRGYAAEAAAAALDDGFGRLDLDEIVAFTVPANQRSQRLMARLGMTRDPEDDFDHPRVPPSDPLRRHVLYRIRRAAWRGLDAVTR
jgi:RimJ/RimL family protein N-acetyltransferase